MSHTWITTGLDVFRPTITYLQDNYSGVAFVLGEVGRKLRDPDGDENLLGIFGSALWTVDFMLYAMTLVSAEQGEKMLPIALFPSHA